MHSAHHRSHLCTEGEFYPVAGIDRGRGLAKLGHFSKLGLVKISHKLAKPFFPPICTKNLHCTIRNLLEPRPRKNYAIFQTRLGPSHQNTKLFLKLFLKQFLKLFISQILPSVDSCQLEIFTTPIIYMVHHRYW